jgi:protein TonB
LDVPVWNPRPAYPSSARKAGWEGCVEIALEVGSDGRVIQARVLSSSGYEILDRAALDALSRWRFAPRRSGSSLKTIHQEVVFRLENTHTVSLVQK